MIITVLFYFLFMLLSYLMGSVNNAIIICRFLNLDIRQLGSGNPGAMNMIRSVGFWWGALTLVMDALKGAVPALFGWYFLGSPYSFDGSRLGACVCGLMVIVGHMFPIFYKFKGGKGVASALGVCFVLNPGLAAFSFALLVAIILITKIGFVASFVGVGIPLIAESVAEFLVGDIIGGMFLLVILCAIIYMHRSNIQRLIEGRENKISLFGSRKNAAKSFVQNNRSERDEDKQDYDK